MTPERETGGGREEAKWHRAAYGARKMSAEMHQMCPCKTDVSMQDGDGHYWASMHGCIGHAWMPSAPVCTHDCTCMNACMHLMRQCAGLACKCGNPKRMCVCRMCVACMAHRAAMAPGDAPAPASRKEAALLGGGDLGAPVSLRLTACVWWG